MIGDKSPDHRAYLMQVPGLHPVAQQATSGVTQSTSRCVTECRLQPRRSSGIWASPDCLVAMSPKALDCATPDVATRPQRAGTGPGMQALVSVEVPNPHSVLRLTVLVGLVRIEKKANS